ncbi:MAG: response regulator [Methylococcales bacterium]|nr:response regulator [Methylococcales bacterium]
MIQLIALTLFFMGFPFAVLFYQMKIYWLACAIIVVLGINILTMAWFRRSKNYVLFGYISLIGVYFLMLGSNFASGGFFNTNFGWFLIIPIVAGLLIHINGMLIFTAIVIMTQLIFFFLNVFQFSMVNQIPTEYQDILHLMNRLLITLTMTITAIGFLFERKVTESIYLANNEISQNEVLIAEQIEHDRTRFMTNMSHEIRTPMNGVLGNLNLLQKSSLNGAQQPLVDDAQYSANTLIHIVNDIIDYSSMMDGKLTLNQSAFSPRYLIQQIGVIYQSRINRKGLELTTEMASDVPETVVGDSHRVNQIIINLVGNALKFTETGHIHIKVTVFNVSHNSIWCRFVVSDTGIGISANHLKKLFKPFQQTQASQEEFGGTGLGLSICKQLVERMHGYIHVDSIEGEGTQFQFELPFQQPSNQVIKEIIKPIKAQLEIENKDKFKLLLAEDNKINQLIALSSLKKMGYQVDLAENGEEVMLAMKSNHYDLILMDCMMPKMDGFKASMKIRQLRPPMCNIPIIALTANVMKADQLKCTQAGMDDFIGKPFDIDNLEKVINKYLVTHD